MTQVNDTRVMLQHAGTSLDDEIITDSIKDAKDIEYLPKYGKRI